MTSVLADPLAIAVMSVWNFEVANLSTAVVKLLSAFTSITGSTDAIEALVLALASSVRVIVFCITKLSITFVIKASVSISTFWAEELNSFSISSEIALK